jgi:preprotein translocase subunit SecG
MQTLLLVVHFVVCILLILLILLQSGKGSAAGIFGASGADNIFASPTAFNAVNKLTAVLAVIVFITSILLTVAYNHKTSSSVMDKVNIPTASAPVR